jgi:hypothetical protein
MEGSCEHGNEHSGSIKCWEISGVSAQIAASQEGLISVKLDTGYTIIETVLENSEIHLK